MKHKAIVLWLAILMICVVAAHAQDIVAPRLDKPTDQNDGIVSLPQEVGQHVIAPRDVIHLVAWTTEQVISNTVITVSTNGTINAPLVGTIPVVGMKVEDLQSKVAGMLLKRYPTITVYVMISGQQVADTTTQGSPNLKVDQRTHTVSLNVNLLSSPLRSGDQLRVRVWTDTTMHLDVVTPVTDEITIALPPLGPVSVKDQTLLSLRDYLLTRFRLYYPSCSVSVLLDSRGNLPVRPDAQITPDEEQVPVWQKFPPDVTATQILQALPRFGASIFAIPEGTSPLSPLSRNAFPAPVTSLPMPADYTIGPGDRVLVHAWTGAIEHFNSELVVTPEGRIYLPLLGEVAVGGQTLGQVTNQLAQRFARYYRGSQTTVSVPQARTVDVFVTGDAAQPGKYTLAGNATVFAALYAAGGPSQIGSLRTIRLSRKGQPQKTLDLYDYLLTGSREADEPLQPGDTIFIGPATNTIGIAGMVRRPALYEVTGTLSITEALKMAAGLDPRGYGPNVEVWRVDQNTSWNVININLNGAGNDRKGPDFKLQSGDLVLVRPVLERLANTVEVIGAVRRPGTYEVGSGLDIATLVKRAEGLDENAYVVQGAIWRLTPTNDYEILRFSVQAALQNDATSNLKLQAGDKVRIYSRQEVIQPQEVAIAGAVAGPGVYPWAQKMRVSDLLLSGRGLLPGAYTGRADLQRLTIDRKQQIMPVELARLLAGDVEADLELQPGDQLTVYNQSDVAVASRVAISGFVQRAGTYDRKAGMKVSDLIYQAGGLLPDADTDIEYTKGRSAGPAEITHLKLSRDGENGFRVLPDIILNDDDHVAVMGAGDFHIRPQTVTVEGLVGKPGTYALTGTAEEPDTIYRLLQRAGQLLPDANPRGIVLYRTQEKLMNGNQTDDVNQVLKTFNREGTGQKTSLTPAAKAAAMNNNLSKQVASIFGNASGGAVVVVPPRPLGYDAWATAVPVEGAKLLATEGKEGDMPLVDGDVVVIPKLPTTVAVLGAVVRPGAVRFEGSKSPQTYVALAGGLTADAEIKRLVVIRANGSALAGSAVRQIEAGDVLIVPSDYMVKQLGGPSGFQKVLQTLAALATTYIIQRY